MSSKHFFWLGYKMMMMNEERQLGKTPGPRVWFNVTYTWTLLGSNLLFGASSHACHMFQTQTSQLVYYDDKYVSD